MIQALAGCIARVYLVYRARGVGVWLIPAALGMAFTLLAILWTAIWAIWRDLPTGTRAGCQTGNRLGKGTGPEGTWSLTREELMPLPGDLMGQ